MPPLPAAVYRQRRKQAPCAGTSGISRGCRCGRTMSKTTRTVHRTAGNPAKDREEGYKLGLRGHELDLLRETADAVSSQPDLDRLFQLVAERARELIQAETVLI